jgi:hypothetical protein
LVIKIHDEFVKSRIHHVFGVSCFVFSMTSMTLYQLVRLLYTYHHTQNTLTKIVGAGFIPARKSARILLRVGINPTPTSNVGLNLYKR